MPVWHWCMLRWEINQTLVSVELITTNFRLHGRCSTWVLATTSVCGVRVCTCACTGVCVYLCFYAYCEWKLRQTCQLYVDTARALLVRLALYMWPQEPCARDSGYAYIPVYSCVSVYVCTRLRTDYISVYVCAHMRVRIYICIYNSCICICV